MQKPEFRPMFTGIIEAQGTIIRLWKEGTNQSFWIQSPLSSSFKVDQSISHNGVCLTVEEIAEGSHRVTAVEETLDKTSLGIWKVGDKINLERSLLPSSRLDGHFVQGHVDTRAFCQKIKPKGGSWEISFSFPKKFAPLVIEKGSVCVDGISLTAFNVKKDRFTVAVIPFTWEHTNLSRLVEGGEVNLEFDLLGKYILRKLELD